MTQDRQVVTVFLMFFSLFAYAGAQVEDGVADGLLLFAMTLALGAAILASPISFMLSLP